ncbi:MAG: hypothetical protein Q9183_003902, partial [Haloplaca sp. 2 TL-2023]
MATTEISQNTEDSANVSNDDSVYLSDTRVAEKEALKEAPVEASSTKEAQGMLLEVKNLYLGERDANGNFSIHTDNKCPEDLPKPEENEDTARFALLVRYWICHGRDNGRAISSILVQSPLLKMVLRSVLEDYPAIAFELDSGFGAPFRPLVHRWQRLTDALNDERDQETRSHIQLFHDMLKEELKATLEARANIISHNVVTFKNLWLIFEPGTMIFNTINERPIAYKLKHITVPSGPNEDIYQLECEAVSHNGESFGWALFGGFGIPYFGGILKIHELPVYPLAYHPRVNRVTKQLIANGMKYEQLAGSHHKMYQGIALRRGQPFYVDSRIIIDASTFVRYNPDQDLAVRPLSRSLATDRDHSPTTLDSSESFDDENGDKAKFNAPLTKEQLMLCRNYVKGYSLRNKRWFHFYVEKIKDIEWKPNAWDNVVMDEGQKDLIHSAINGHCRGRKDHHSGGLNIALSGHTGVGKTLIVESLAEHLHAPLFHVKAADLDVDHSDPDLESPFAKMLEVSSIWNAI